MMKIKILYFGRPGENMKLSDETVEIAETIKTLGELLAWLRSRGENWALELSESRVRCAINQEFAEMSATIKVNDEVAIFSPISGG
jgi:molybdopterin synthase sulfur carrier subunit